MSYQDFEKAMKLAPQCMDYEVDEGISEDKIRKAEELLGIQFSKQCRDFYKKYNYIAFCGYEIDGIDPDSSFKAGNAVATALADRKEWGLPEKWIPLCFLDDGYYAYMDYSQLNAEGEPRIVEAIYTGEENLEEDFDEDDEFDEDDDEPEDYCRYQITEVLAVDFGEFLLGLVEEALVEEEPQQPEAVNGTSKNKPMDEWDKKFKSMDDKMDEIDRLLAELRKLKEQEGL